MRDPVDTRKHFYIAVDFDGTIVTHEFPGIGEKIGAFSWLQKFEDAGAKLILWTMRSDGERGMILTDAVDFCEDNGIIFHGVNSNPQSWTTSPKAYAKVYIDDAAFGCPLIDNPGGKPFVNWDIVGPSVLEMIENFYK